MRRALLLERCRPGSWLSELPEDEALTVALGVRAFDVASLLRDGQPAQRRLDRVASDLDLDISGEQRVDSVCERVDRRTHPPWLLGPRRRDGRRELVDALLHPRRDALAHAQ